MSTMMITPPDWFDRALKPRQRRIFVLRWNPAISSYTTERFLEHFSQYKAGEGLDMDWSVWDWETVMHRDLYVMMRVGGENNGIVWAGYLVGQPYQYQYKDGRMSKSHYFEIDYTFMNHCEKTGILTAQRLNEVIPEVDWEHGHSGELLSVDAGEKLALFIGNELLHAEEGDNLVIDDFEQKPYVIGDTVGFLCPELKRKLRKAGKTTDECFYESGRPRQINDLLVHYDNEKVTPGCRLEDILYLKRKNGCRV